MAQDTRPPIPAADIDELVQLHGLEVSNLRQQITILEQQLALEKQRVETYQALAGAGRRPWWKKPELLLSIGVAAVSTITTAR